MSKNSRLVYSSDAGRLCPECRQARNACICKRLAKTADAVASGNNIRIQRQTKGRKGKGVTLITGLPLDSQALNDLAKQLKKRCATGGTVKQGVIEIQGDYREQLLAQLQQLGYSAKIAGG